MPFDYVMIVKRVTCVQSSVNYSGIFSLCLEVTIDCFTLKCRLNCFHFLTLLRHKAILEICSNFSLEISRKYVIDCFLYI